MNWRAFAALLALVAGLALVTGLLMLVRRPSTATFFLTGDTEGLLVPCGCRTTPSGGLARRATLLEQLRKDPEAGLVIPVEMAHGFADRGPGRDLLNRAMGAFFRERDCRVGVGSYDLAPGLATLRGWAPGVRLYGAGIEGLEAYEDLALGGWGVGPFGARGQVLRVLFLSETAPGGAALPPPLATFRRLRAVPGADAWVVFGNLSPETVAALVKEAPDLLAVVACWHNSVTSLPQRAGATWLVFNGDKGRRYTALTVGRIAGSWSVWPRGGFLGPEVASLPEAQRGAESVLARVAALNRAALERQSAAAGPRPYAGTSSCRPCHAEAHRLWSLSRHARATADLAIDHQESNPDCLACHATGTGRPGGYPGAPGGPDLAGVGCEACHGPAAGHPPAPVPRGDATAEACGGCHTGRDSPSFDAAGYWQLIRHPAGAAPAPAATGR